MTWTDAVPSDGNPAINMIELNWDTVQEQPPQPDNH
jgi:hypothetical protein